MQYKKSLIYKSNIERGTFMNREYLKDILVVSEVSDMLGVSKQQINNLVKKGKLIPAKRTPNGYLFLREDIDDYLQQKIKVNLQKTKEIFWNGITHKSKEYFDNVITDCDKIQSVNIYFDRSGAIFDGYYMQTERFQKNQLIRIQAPTFVITYDDGKEFWFDGFNCGYVGEGPYGSYYVLTKLGMQKEEADILFRSEWVRCYREASGWEIIHKEISLEHRQEESNKNWIQKCELRGEFCLFNHQLILLQKRMNRYELDTKLVAVLSKYSYFIPQPVSVTFMTKEEAWKTGHYVTSTLGSTFYQIIIKDMTGRELWLDYYVDENVTIRKQQNLQTILEKLGMKIFKDDSSNLTTRLENWLSIEPRIVDKLSAKKYEID